MKPLQGSHPEAGTNFPVLPGGLPIIGHIPVLYNDAVGALKKASQEVGPVIWVNMGFGIRKLFCLGTSSYELFKHKALSSEGGYHDGMVGHLAGESVIAQDDEPHRRVRTAMSPTFSPRGLAQGGIGDRIAKTISSRVGKIVDQRQTKILTEMQELAIEIILRTMGIHTQDIPTWRKYYHDYTLGILPIPIMLPGFPRYRSMQALKWIDARMSELIASARQSPREGTTVNSLVHAKDEAGQPLSDTEISNNLRLLIFAGHESTAAILSWTAITVAQNPTYWDALCSEVKSVSSFTVPTSIEQAKKFPVAESIFRECVRFYAPFWFLMRKSTDWVDFAGSRIPPGTPVCVSPALLARDPAIFKDPDHFDISRWQGRTGPPSHIETSQFGSGSHFCLGYNQAWLECVVFLVALAANLAPKNMRPRIVAGISPKQMYLPIGHPRASTLIEFV